MTWFLEVGLRTVNGEKQEVMEPGPGLRCTASAQREPGAAKPEALAGAEVALVLHGTHDSD